LRVLADREETALGDNAEQELAHAHIAVRHHQIAGR